MNKFSVMSVFVLFMAALAFGRVVDVSIYDFGFNPPAVQVNQGDTIRWTNTGSVLHTSTGGKSDSMPGLLWDSPDLAHNQTYEVPVTFTGASIPYFCRHHFLTMKGFVSVNAGVSEGPQAVPAGLRLMLRSLNPEAVSVQLPSRLRVSLRIYDAVGKEAATLLDNVLLESGPHGVRLNRLELTDGVYLVSLAVGAATRTARMTILR